MPPTSTPLAGPTTTAPTRRPGPSLKLSIGLLAVAAVVGTVAVIMIVRNAGQAFTDPVRRTPGEFTIDAHKATYAVYERTGTTSQVGNATFSEGRGGVLTPRNVTVTGPGGAVIAGRQPGNVTETVTRGSSVFTATVRFEVPAAGRYTVRIGGPATEVVVAPTLGDTFRAVVGWILAIVAAVLVGLLGLVLLIVGAVRRRNADSRASLAAAVAAPYGAYAPGGYAPGAYPPAAPTTPPTSSFPTAGPAPSAGSFPTAGASPTTAPGWYPDPWNPSLYRYYDGQAWTGHTSPRTG